MRKIAELKAELDAGHPSTGAYSADVTGKTAADELNAVNRTRVVPIQSAELLAWAAANERLSRVEQGRASANASVKAMSEAAYLMITRDGTSLDLSLSDRMALVDGLVAATVFTASDKTSLVALGTEDISRATELGLGRIKPGHVQEARRFGN